MKRYLSLSLKALLVILFMATVPENGNAQSRDRKYIKNCIKENGECKNVAITKRNGDVMLYGDNGWAASGCPQAMVTALRELHDAYEHINDVHLTESGKWLILYGDNGAKWSGLPYKLEQKIREWNKDGEVITSISFNDSGDWVAVSKNYISSSSTEIQDFVVEGMDNYGAVLTTCVTDDAIVVVYEEGFRTFGKIPSDLMDKLKETSINVYRLKIAGDSWFFSDGKSIYHYSM